MSTYSIIQATTLELRRRIFSALTTAPDADFGLTNAEKDITLSPPARQMQGNPHLSLFLHHIEPDPSLRNQPPLPAGNAALRLPPLTLQLHYLITPLNEDEDDNQLMLGRIFQYFHDHPELQELNGTPLDNSFGGASPAFRIALEPLSTQELFQIWSALDAPYRLSVSYLLRVVAIDSDKGLTEAHRIVEALTVVGRAE